MAGHGNIKNLKPWKPGQSGHPGRIGILPPDIREERKKNQVGLIRMVSEMMMFNEKEAKVKFKAAETTQLEKACQALIGKARDGDVNAFRYLMELMVGNIPSHDYDGFTEEDLRILNRVKEVFAEQKGINTEQTSKSVGDGH